MENFDETNMNSNFEGGYWDSEGFYRFEDGSYMTENGEFFDPEGKDRYGGYYDEYGVYIQGRENQENYRSPNDEELNEDNIDELGFYEEVGDEMNYLDDLEEEFEEYNSKRKLFRSENVHQDSSGGNNPFHN